jgi:alpha-glucosidase
MPPSSGVILQHKNKPVRKQEDLKTNEKTNGKNFLQFQ